MSEKISGKSWKATVVWFHLLGLFGAHRYYVGKILTGLLWTFTFGIFGIGVIMDGIMLYTGNFTDEDGALVLPLYKRILLDTIRRAQFAGQSEDAAAPAVHDTPAAPTVPKVPEGSVSLVRKESTAPDVLAMPSFVVLDTETTGLSAENDKIVEIALLKIAGGQIVDEYCTLVNPDMRIPPRSTKIHGIKDEDVKNAPQYSEVGNAVAQFLGDCTIIGHNVKFDLGFMGGLLKNVVLPEDVTWNYVDTIPLAKAAYPDMPNYKLETLVERLSINTDGAHRARADAIAAWKLFERCRSVMAQE